jgi:Ca2+-binding EF-hand superfamily protein
VQNLREIFDLFDKEKNGVIDSNDLETIMGSLQRDPAEVRDYIDQLGEQISFEQFIDLMQQVENRIVN